MQRVIAQPWTQQWHSRSSKNPGFKQKFTKEALWIDDGWWLSSSILGEEQVCIEKQEISQDSKKESLSFVTLLKACASKKDLYEGSRLHADICNSGLLEKNTYLGNTLISMYAKCGELVKAQEVFNELAVRNVVSWNTLIAGYVQQRQGGEALGCFHRMRSEGFPPSAITYACILKACGILQEADMGKQIHDEIVSQGLLEKDVVLGNVLIDMYAKCGVLTRAQKVLDELRVQDVVSWNALIAGYIHQRHGEAALDCFARMQSEGFSPNAITYTCTLKACGIMQAADMGEQIHEEIVSQGLLEKNVVLGNALIDMYAKCGVLARAQKVLDELCVRNVVSWNALIAGYAQEKQGEEALCCFQRMQSEGLSPDRITYASILKVCGIAQDAHMGRKIHDEIASQGLLEKDFVLVIALVDMYSKCGVLSKAQEVLEGLPVQTIISWNALITRYVHQKHGKEALDCFQMMDSEGLSPDLSTYACVLKACGIIEKVDAGRKFHNEIVGQELLDENAMLGNDLVSMCAKCGALTKAKATY